MKTTSADEVKPRLTGNTARRIKRLSEQTGISENRIANLVADAGIKAVERKLKP